MSEFIHPRDVEFNKNEEKNCERGEYWEPRKQILSQGKWLRGRLLIAIKKEKGAAKKASATEDQEFSGREGKNGLEWLWRMLRS